MKNLFLPFLLLLTFLFSCRTSDENDVLEKKLNSYDVYVAGRENNMACYWKNGVKTNLVFGTGITPFKIIVENNDIYILAKSDTEPNYYLWKNNVKTDIHQYIGMNPNSMSPTEFTHTIYDIQIDQGNIYLFGRITSPITQIPPNGTNFSTNEICYWKNGLKTILFTGNSNFDQPYVTTRNFTIFNGDVYIPINKMYNKFTDSPYELGYFKNSTYHIIASYAEYKSLANVSKGLNGVHISIYDKINNNTFYKNITTNTNSYTSQTSKSRFMIDGNDIYDFSNGQNYFKNDISTTLIYDTGFNFTEDLFALHQNVYQIRSKSLNDKKDSFKVYINDNEIQHLNAADGILTSIFVIAN